MPRTANFVFTPLPDATTRVVVRGMNTLPTLGVAALRDHSVLLWNTASLVATTGLTSGLGFLYWGLAARRFSAADVGLAAATVSAMGLLSFLAMFGLGTVLVGELAKQRGDRRSLITTCVLAAAAIGVVSGIAFAAAAPALSNDFGPLRATFITVLLFASGVGLSAAGMVLDQALIGLLRGDIQLLRNVIASVVKLAALVIVAVTAVSATGIDIFGTWVLGAAVSIGVLVLSAFVLGHHPGSYAPRLGALRGLLREAVSHHALNVSLQAPTLVLPIIVTVLLSATANAYFYIAFMVAGLVFVGPSNLALTLYAVASRDLARVGPTVRFTLAMSVVGGAIVTVFLFIAGGRVLALFGPSYEYESITSLLILTVGVFPMIVRSHYVALARIHGLTARALRVVVPAAALQLVLSVVGAATAGLPGLCLGWVVGAGIEAVWMLPLVLRIVAPKTVSGRVL